MSKKLKVALVCPYSYPSVCGIWSRVYSDAKALKDSGFEVHIFTSSIIKGTPNHSASNELFDGLHIHRSRPILSLGENALFWPQVFFKIFRNNFDAVHVHGYRHPHTLFALIAGKLKGTVTFLTTHGPFEKDPRERLILKLFTRAFDILIGWWYLKLFNQVIRITNWEESYLKRLGCSNSILIPNGINPIFLNQINDRTSKQANQPTNKLLFMSRVDPVKRPEWFINVASEFPEYKFTLRGPLHGYDKLEPKSSNIEMKLEKYNHTEFISELDNSDIYVLPSIRESFGIVILEAMARGIVVITTNTRGPSEYLKDNINGFVIETEDGLKEKIKYVYQNWDKMSSIRSNAIKTASEYSEDKTTQALLKLYQSELKVKNEE